MTDYMKWLGDVAAELSDDHITVGRVSMMEKIRSLRNEAATGTFHDANGELVVVANQELCGLIFLAYAENWIGWLAYNEGRKEDGVRHHRAYTEASNEIYSDRFTDEEQALAYNILD